MEEQILQAIQIAGDPSANRSLQAQAVDFLATVRQNATDTWSIALQFFLQQNQDGSRKHTFQVRLFSLQLLDDFLDSGAGELDASAFQTIEEALVSYIRSEYVYGSAEASSPFIRNKFSHTLALLFVSTYPHQWPSFFSTMFTLLRTQSDPSTSAAGSSAAPDSLPPLNPHVSILFLRVLIEISGEVHDTTLKSARTFVQERFNRDTRVRDEIRNRDAGDMNTVVLTVISEGEQRLIQFRERIDAGGGVSNPELDRTRARLEEVVDYGIRAFASYVQWIDINLTVNEHTVPLIFRLLADPSSPIRQATAHTLLRIVQKGLKEPSDKLRLIQVLSLGEVLEALEAKTRKGTQERKNVGTRKEDGEAEEAYREALGKLACGLGLELVKLVDDLLPVVLHILADEYDDTSSTVLPLMSTVLSTYKKAKKSYPTTHLTETKRSFLASNLTVVIQKMKWDPEEFAGEDEDPDEAFEDMDEDDRLAFDTMRKDLKNLLDSILAIDEELVTEAIRSIALSTLSEIQKTALGSGDAGETGTAIPWQDAELAVYLVFLYGEVNKTGKEKGKFNFVHLPPDLVADKEKRKVADLSKLPLTPQGELMYALVNSGVSHYPHVAVRGMFFECIGRYGEFFKARKDCMVLVLEALVDTRGMHQLKKTRRGRSFYIFNRFIREVRSDLPTSLLPSVLQSIHDLLELHVELPSPSNDSGFAARGGSEGSSPIPEQDLLEEAVRTPGLFDHQLYLFEATGMLIAMAESDEQQVALIQAITNPLLADLSRTLQVPVEILTVLRTHHLIEALASVVKGFPDVPSPIPADYAPPGRTEVFKQVAEAVAVSLEVMSGWKVIREATRFAYTRIVATSGFVVAPYIPSLILKLLSSPFEPSELVDFLGFLGLVLHRLENHVGDMVDQLVVPIHTHVTQLLAQPTDGTDIKSVQTSTKRAYMEFLSSITSSAQLCTVFISERNASNIESIISLVVQIALDSSDPSGQKLSFVLLGRFVQQFATPPNTDGSSNAAGDDKGKPPSESRYVPGFESFVYERLLPLAFEVPSVPEFNLKDGQCLTLLGEIGVFLKTIHKARGQEALDFLANSFLPSKNSPEATTVEFVSKLRDSDAKVFRKYFTDFVKASSGAAGSGRR